MPSVCHNVILASLSICQFQDSSVCKPTHDVINPTIGLTVCSSSVTSILQSANPKLKMPTSIPVHNFLHEQNLGKFLLSVHQWIHLSITDSLSINSAANPSKIPCNYGEKAMVNYLHKNPDKSPTISILYVTPFSAPVSASSIQSVHTLCNTSVVAPVRALPVPSVHPCDDACQEFPDGFPGTKYGEKNLSKITVKLPHIITLTLQQAKFPEETPDTTKRIIYPGKFMLT